MCEIDLSSPTLPPTSDEVMAAARLNRKRCHSLSEQEANVSRRRPAYCNLIHGVCVCVCVLCVCVFVHVCVHDVSIYVCVCEGSNANTA